MTKAMNSSDLPITNVRLLESQHRLLDTMRPLTSQSIFYVSPNQHLQDVRVAFSSTVLSTFWTPEEQDVLENGIACEGNENLFSPEKILRISSLLPAKSARDVAIRIRYMQDLLATAKRRAVVPRRSSSSSLRSLKRDSEGSEIDVNFPRLRLSSASGPDDAPLMTGSQLVEHMEAGLAEYDHSGAQHADGEGGFQGKRTKRIAERRGLNMVLSPIAVPARELRFNDILPDSAPEGIEIRRDALLRDNSNILATLKSYLQQGRLEDGPQMMLRFVNNVAAINSDMDMIGEGPLAHLPPLPAVNTSLLPYQSPTTNTSSTASHILSQFR